MKKHQIIKICLCALFSAVIACTAMLSLPTPFGVNLTMQMFAVCLAGFILGPRAAVASVAVYLAAGAAGLPVFSSFTGGIGVVLGPSGGFLWGFLLTSLFCGFAAKVDKKGIKILLCLLSVVLCHLVGVIQYTVVTATPVYTALLTASLPFLPKDFAVLFLSLIAARKIKEKIKI